MHRLAGDASQGNRLHYRIRSRMALAVKNYRSHLSGLRWALQLRMRQSLFPTHSAPLRCSLLLTFGVFPEKMSNWDSTRIKFSIRKFLVTTLVCHLDEPKELFYFAFR
jgi:hypothetical protein